MIRPSGSKALMILAILAGVLLVTKPEPAQAIFGVGDQTFNTTVADIPRDITNAIDKAAKTVEKRVKDATAVAFKNSTRTFLATITKEFATTLATTAPGQKPLFLTNPKTFFRDVADTAAGNFIDDFTKGVTGGTWDKRCDSTDPEIRKQCSGIQGGTSGPNGTLDQKGRFIISRLLRAGAQGTIDGCIAQCKKDFGTVTEKALTYAQVQNIIDISTLKDYNNDHERKIAIMRAWIETPNVGTKALKDQNGDQGVVCRDVFDSTGSVYHLGEVVYAVTPTICRPGGESPLGWNCNVTAQECYNRQMQALDNELQQASKQQSNCMKNSCGSQFGNTARSMINQATATDVFAYAKNFDIRNSPETIAARFSGKSDISQYFSAASALNAVIQDRIKGENTTLSAGVLPRTAKVSQKVMTPKEATSALFGVPFYGQNGELTFTGTGLADILKGVASFLNSPVGKAIFTYFRSKCGLNPDACKGPTNAQSTIGQILFGNSASGGIAAARSQFAGLGQADIITGDPGKNEVDVLSQLASAGLLDPQFQSAIQSGMTVRQALDQKVISGQKIVGFDKSGVEPKDGYPYRQLQYLRKYRIIPIGWELAAKYNLRFQSQDLTLDILTKHYDICAQDISHKVCSSSLKSCQQDTDCLSGESCGASPYCGLVDPDWVLKIPQTFCRRQGAGEEIISKEFVCDQNNVDKETGKVIPHGTTCKSAESDTGNNAFCHDVDAPNCVFDAENNPHPDIGNWTITRNTDSCGDTQSCLSENEDGTCQAYGYCVQERQTYKFDGENCQAQEASCSTYTTSSNEKVSYLAKNLDSSCSPESAGCQWYCAKPSYDDKAKTWTCTATTGQKIYLTDQAQKCSSNQVGCRQFIRLVPGTNYLPNGGFEIYEGGDLNNAPALFTGWSSGIVSMTPVTSDDSGNSSGNKVAVRVQAPTTSDTISQTINLGSTLSSRTFTFSVRAKANAICDGSISLCTGPSCSSAALRPVVTINPTTSWQTYSVTLAVPAAASMSIPDTRLTTVITPGNCFNLGLTIDNAQLQELPAAPNTFIEYGANNLVYLNGSRRSCQAADVGCQKYTPLAGGPAVNGIVQEGNRCSKDFVGCQLFHREPIAKLPYRDYDPAATGRGGVDVTIVAPKGKQCAAMDVGCEEYTNLDQVTQGGESKAYFRSVKQCAKPSNTNVTKQTYYTWVGDNDKGFVLRSYQLVANSTGAPCTSLELANNSSTNPSCNDDNASILAATCTLADMATNADCTEFYDGNLRAYYRLRSKTITVTENCHPYRNTIDETDPAYVANKDRVYFLSAKENISCTAAGAGCRAYTGNTGQTSRAVLRDAFEDRKLSNWIGGQWSLASPNAGSHSLRIDRAPAQTSGAAFTTADMLKQKLATGKTYLLTFNAASGTSTGNPRIRAFLGTGIDTTGVFETNSAINFAPAEGAALAWNETITPPGPEWRAYTLGPVTISGEVYPEWRLGLVVEGGTAYVDNLVLTEINDRIYQINNSAPACPADAIGCAAYRKKSGPTEYLTSFNRLCSDQVVGCEAMIDNQNSITPFSQTVKDITTPADQLVTVVNDSANYCPSTAKGCEALGEPIYARDDTMSGFENVYKRNDPDRYESDICLASEDSCDVYQTSDGGTVYFKNPRQRTCEFKAGSTNDPGAWYITGTTYRCPIITPPAVGQPVGRSCSPICQGGERNGRPCSNSSSCPGGSCPGDINLIGRVNNNAGRPVIGACTQDSDCADNAQRCVYLVGMCSETANGCTEYRDPTEPANCRSECPLEQSGGTPIYVDNNCVKTVCTSADQTNKRNGQNCQTTDQCGTNGTCVGTDGVTPTSGQAGCRPYYLLKQSVTDTSGDCNGELNSAIGCRSFNDTSDPSLNFRGQ